MKERRRSHRATPVDDLCVTIGGNRPARVVDVSPEGAHLELASALNPRGECRISFPLPDGVVRLKALVVHCKLTGYLSFGSGGQLVYHAGVKFLDLDPKLAEAISRAFPPPPPPQETKQARRGPIKIKVNVDALENAVDEETHEPQ